MIFKGVVVAALSAAFVPTASAAGRLQELQHTDGRNTPQMIFEVNQSVTSKNLITAAENYLRKNASSFALSPGLQNLKFVKEQKSLTGSHFHFVQQVNGVPVEGGEIIVSISNKDQKIFQVFNNTFPVSESEKRSLLAESKSANFAGDQAFDVAWNDLRVHGSLIDTPKAETVIISHKGQLRLVKKIYLAVEKPFGYWQYLVDVKTGEILSYQDLRITRKHEPTVDFKKYRGPVWSRVESFKNYLGKKQLSKGTTASLRGAQGDGLVFDPDPRTTLNNNSLQDTSPAADFESAYFRRELKDITHDGTNYILAGPWIKIADFESPATAPSVSATGRWEARRGDNAFNDVMTYYHIDKNQRYMQSLGFSGNRGIQFGQIHVDSDGVNGSDNSHFIPSSNRMAFGHGCVDDNEDVDVILHEYGHAIHYSINNNWGGGDSGAMGEGFGDYWAGSYSISTDTGKNFRVNEVFSWDGQGEGSPCWPGRRMDRLEARYDHNRNYSAHTSIGGGLQSDELWSTPLFQSLLALRERGYPRENVDRIILEAHFGLGSGMKMRGMAEAIIATARRMYPNDAYADVFIEKFAHHGIIDLPKASFQVKDLILQGAGSNGRVDPGETIELSLKLQNAGTFDASSISGDLSSSTAGVEIAQSRLQLPDAGKGAEVVTLPVRIRVSEQVGCGDKLNFNLKLAFSGGAASSQSLSFDLGTGEAIGMEAQRVYEGGIAIPDNQPTQGVQSEIQVSGTEGSLKTESLKINLEIMHTYIGDLTVKLVAPGGKSVVLHGKSGGSQDNLIGTYPTTLTPKEALSGLAGSPMNGTWSLLVTDHANSDTGSLLKWGLQAVDRYRCQ